MGGTISSETTGGNYLTLYQINHHDDDEENYVYFSNLLGLFCLLSESIHKKDEKIFLQQYKFPLNVPKLMSLTNFISLHQIPTLFDEIKSVDDKSICKELFDKINAKINDKLNENVETKENESEEEKNLKILEVAEKIENMYGDVFVIMSEHKNLLKKEKSYSLDVQKLISTLKDTNTTLESIKGYLSLKYLEDNKIIQDGRKRRSKKKSKRRSKKKSKRRSKRKM